MAARRPSKKDEHLCPDCGTAVLIAGRLTCQACAALKLYRSREELAAPADAM